ncbi:hypothetical protein PINS_up000085 [Pythium insidiosum]|nr:hypothetical protein PINS_up000085 [Pythium insidiosum]
MRGAQSTGESPTPDDALPSVEAVEDLILEAYNSMQSDGEYIFLSQDIADKLHHVAQLVENAGYCRSSSDLQSSHSTSPPVSNQTLVDEIDTAIDQLQLASAPGEERQDDNPEVLAIEVLPSQEGKKEPEEVTPALDNQSNAQPTTPETLSPPPRSFLRAPTTSRRRTLTRTSYERHEKDDPPTSHRRESHVASRDSHTTTSNPKAASASHDPRSTAAAVRSRKDSAATAETRERSTSSYEQRREAAQKLREDRAQRELHAREAARKQKEEAKRLLEEAHQKELAQKRERVQRMRQLKEQRKGGASKNPTSAASK